MSENVERDLRRLLDSEWAANYEISHAGSGHLRVVLKTEDDHQTVFWPSTPSDHRSLLNCKAQLRRAMRTLLGIDTSEKKPQGSKKQRKYRKKIARNKSIDLQPTINRETIKKIASFPVPVKEGDVVSRKANRYVFEKPAKPVKRVTRMQLAKELDVSGARISQMVSSGFLDGTYVGEGKDRRFDLQAVIDRREAHWRFLAEKYGVDLDEE